jgi:hypothetical protein
MINSLFVEFQQHSQDYLRLLGEKSRRASRSKQEADELSVMEFFWDGVEEIFKKYESELAHLRILAANEHAKGVLLTNELKSTYNELYKIRKDKPELIAMLMARTKLPTAEDLKQDVIVKNGSTKQD